MFTYEIIKYPNIHFKITSIICMSNELRFNCYILNNKYNYLNLSLGKTLCQDFNKVEKKMKKENHLVF